MEKSEKHRLGHKSKIKEKDNNQIKAKSRKIKEQTKESNALKNSILVNGEVSILQNHSNQIQKKQELPLQDEDSYNGIQLQKIKDPQSIKVPSSSSIINQQNTQKILFGYISEEIICPYCHKTMKTDIEQDFNCASCIIFCISFLFPPLFMFFMVCGNIEECICEFSCENISCNICDSQCGCCYYLSCCSCPRSENPNCCCCDVEHYCSKCGKLIGRKNSLSSLCPSCCCCCC